MGLAEARLSLQKEAVEALAELEALSGHSQVPASVMMRYSLVLARALSANGRHEESSQRLKALKPQGKHEQFEVAFASGLAHRSAGRMDLAQKDFEVASSLDDKSSQSKEALGRAYLARSREKELLEKIKADKSDRLVSLLRGVAHFTLGDFKKARVELQQTQVNGKFPAEAAAYLSLCDAQDQPDKALETLEKIVATTKKNRAVVQVALARVLIQKGALDKARIQLEEAAKDPSDYEGNSLLGELLLNAGLLPEVAIEPLMKAVERNGSHVPSRNLLGRALLQAGKYPEALKSAEAWVLDNPSLDMAQRQAAVAYWQSGRIKEAQAALAKTKMEGEDSEALRNRAQILFAAGEAAGAMAALTQANKNDSKDAQTFCEIGFAFVREGNADLAPAAFSPALVNNPKSVCAQYGPLFAKPSSRGKPAPIGFLEKLQHQAGSAWEHAQILATLARVRLDAKDVAGARSTVNEALTAAPFASFVHYADAEVARREKSESGVLEALTKAAGYDLSNTQIRMALGEALARKGAPQAAVASVEFEAVIALSKNDADVAKAKRLLTQVKALQK
jgi:cellulose synthase operon protein C